MLGHVWSYLRMGKLNMGKNNDKNPYFTEACYWKVWKMGESIFAQI